MQDTHQSALGQLVISFNSLEEALTIGLSELTPLDYPSASIIFGSTSFKLKCKIILGLACRTQRKEADLNNLKILLNQSAKVEESRNRLLHSDWTLYQTALGVERRREKVRYTKKGADFVNETFKIEDILNIVTHCQDCVTLLEYWFMDGDIHGWYDPLPWGLQHIE